MTNRAWESSVFAGRVRPSFRGDYPKTLPVSPCEFTETTARNLPEDENLQRMATSPLLRLQNVTKCYGIWSRTEAIRGINLTIDEGEHTLILGQKGAGKSTLLRLMVGATKPTNGVVRWRSQRPKFGLAPQCPRLTGRRTVLEYLRSASACLRDAAYLFNRCIAALQLEPLLDIRLAALTPAQARRASLAAAFLSDSPIMVLDDSFSHLESLIRPLARSFITWSLSDPSRYTIIATSRSLDDLQLPFERAIVIDDGRLVRDLRSRALREYSRGEVVCMPTDVPSDVLRERIIRRGAAADQAQFVHGSLGGSPMIIAGPFPRGLLTGEDVRPLSLDLMLQLWQRRAIDPVRVRHLSNTAIHRPGIF
jgi:ABC-type multidrug transport system ATPase subunit